MKNKILKSVRDNSLFEYMAEIRQTLHQNPELSWKEVKTCQYIKTYLKHLGLTFTNMAKTGVIAEIAGKKNGPFIALRADIDALPIQEETGLPYMSKNKGIMHACGHDGHTAMVLGAAKLLLESPTPPELPVRLIFQPAEEIGEGAKAMIDAGALENVAAIFGGHLDRNYKTGTIMLHNGAVNASSDTLSITVEGKSGHGARPHQSIDTIVIGSAIVTALQSLISRTTNPAEPAVITVGTFKSGVAHNVIAGEAILTGTIRTHKKSVREELHKKIHHISQSIGLAYNAKVIVKIKKGPAPVINLPELIPIASKAITLALGEQACVHQEITNMGAEDFSYYLDVTQGIYVRIGASKNKCSLHAAHSNTFDFDESALITGAKYFSSIAQFAGKHIASKKSI